MLVVLVVAIQPPTIPVGVYAGYALDQNALTDLLFRRWLTDAFFVQITDAPTVAALVALRDSSRYRVQTLKLL